MRKCRNMKLRVKNLVEKYNTSNPYVLCEKLNIEIRYFYYEGIKGFFRRILKRKYIVINEKLDEYERANYNKIEVIESLEKLIILCEKAEKENKTIRCRKITVRMENNK